MKILKNLLTQKERESIYEWWNSYKNIPDDHQAIGTKAIRQPKFLTPYLDKIKPILEKETNYKLTNKFSAIRMYRKGDKLEKHTDNAAEFATSIIVKQSDNKNNSLLFYDEDIITVNLQEGEGCYFRGTKVPHERLEVQSDFILHIYLGYDIQTNII
tara:strand:+ start:953 stop:1423 length:471 start_codon:yes stop_codon:yes gene_type:complete